MDMTEKFDTAKAIIDRHPTETEQTRRETAHADLRAAAQAVIDSVRWYGRPLDQNWGHNNRSPESVHEGHQATVSVQAAMRLRDLLDG